MKENGLYQLARTSRNQDLSMDPGQCKFFLGKHDFGEDQGLMCMEIEVPTPSLVANIAWISISRGVTQLARQSSEFVPEIEGTDCVLVHGGTAVAQAQPEAPELSIGRPIAFHS